jgi:hydroxymethylpyrimidine/phosphomethylpyrimidine kinase
MAAPPPRVLTIAGSDSGGCSGAPADLRTFAAYGVHGLCALTAVTAQSAAEVRAVEPLGPDLVRQQLETAEEIGIEAIKIGMLADAATVEVVASWLERLPPTPAVLDPVLRSTSGTALLDAEAIPMLVERLLPQLLLVTPNLFEAEALSGETITGLEEARNAARRIERMGPSVLVTGGHGYPAAASRSNGGTAGGGGEVTDLLFDGNRFEAFVHPRIRTRWRRGTGCTLSAAVAAGLGWHLPLQEAVRRAVAFVERALRGSYPLGRSGGHGTLDPMAGRRGRR